MVLKLFKTCPLFCKQNSYPLFLKKTKLPLFFMQAKVASLLPHKGKPFVPPLTTQTKSKIQVILSDFLI